jgi:branched-chain amino acid transport system ATP-binding protein
MSNVPKLEVRDVRKNFGSLTAVSDVSMRVESGELRAVIGPNGAGKTTFFNLITGFFAPTSGDILLDGNNINKVPAAGRVKLGMGRTFQITEIFPELTVRENARIAVESGLGFSMRAWLTGVDQKRVADASDEVMTMANLTAKADRLVGELSHGDQRSAWRWRSNPACCCWMSRRPAWGMRRPIRSRVLSGGCTRNPVTRSC